MTTVTIKKNGAAHFVEHQNNHGTNGVGLRSLLLSLNLAIVCCAVVAQSHAVDGTSNGHLTPMVPNSQILSMQSDPNFLRFGRSGASLNEFNSAHQTPTRTSSNFLRFGKASMSASEPNFLRFGRQKGGGGVDPTFLRFGRANNNNFLRFGRALGDEMLIPVADDDTLFAREYRQANPNFLRFGK
uniref:Putative effector protein n=1 Tax=Heterodera avenae TaxID=34510 RepID=A0A2L0VDG2_HETAV|nr:putative effector protein [Heterodera avenae]